MVLHEAFQRDPALWLARERPDEPVFFHDPKRLREVAQQFLERFPGEVTYAVKANPDRGVIETLAEAGMEAFDVASPEEMALVRSSSARCSNIKSGRRW